jgi:hypothetical protein
MILPTWWAGLMGESEKGLRRTKDGRKTKDWSIRHVVPSNHSVTKRSFKNGKAKPSLLDKLESRPTRPYEWKQTIDSSKFMSYVCPAVVWRQKTEN